MPQKRAALPPKTGAYPNYRRRDTGGQDRIATAALEPQFFQSSGIVCADDPVVTSAVAMKLLSRSQTVSKSATAFLIAVLALGAAASFTRQAHAAPKAPKPSSSVVEGEDIPVQEGEQPPVDPGADQEGAGTGKSRPVPPSTGEPAPVTLTAYLSEGSAPMASDVTWRIYEGHPADDGGYRLVTTLRDARPTVELKPGEYLINIAYGRASLTKKVGVWPQNPASEDFVVNAGGLRLSATLAQGSNCYGEPFKVRDLHGCPRPIRQPAENLGRSEARRRDPAEQRPLPYRQHLWRWKLGHHIGRRGRTTARSPKRSSTMTQARSL